jgi:8-oxo-dGTP pyrophosphatase MutT (NUDIX family)
MDDFASLLTTLQAIPRPDGAEEWLDALPIDDMDGTVSPEYSRGVNDVLRLLGAVRLDGEEVSTPMGYYLVRSLIALLHDRTRNSYDMRLAWQGKLNGAEEGMGARLIHLLETYRLTYLPDPLPLRTISAVMAVIKAWRDGQDVFLMQYDHKAEQFQPIGGKCEVYDADNYAALLRELREELVLDHLELGKDLEITPIAEHQSHRRVSATLQLITQYDHSFYHLTAVRFPINTDADTHWLTLDEVLSGHTADGKKVSGLLASLNVETLRALPYSVE